MKNNIIIPADVPTNADQEFLSNYQAITSPHGRLFLFAADQKIEHLNQDFYGPDIHEDVQKPEHLFEIASQGTIGAFATHLGLISRYGKQHPNINYVAKLNAKTNLLDQDPLSEQLWDVKEVVKLKEQSSLKIRAIGFTLYLGSEYEHKMLNQAAQSIFEAHQHGLVAIVWSYVRGKAIKNDQDPEILAGAAGIANALGADFVKIKPPHNPQDLKIAVAAAGNTKVICSGQKRTNPQQFLQTLQEQLNAGAAGCATGRNIFQNSTKEAITMTKEIAKVIQ